MDLSDQEKMEAEIRRRTDSGIAEMEAEIKRRTGQGLIAANEERLRGEKEVERGEASQELREREASMHPLAKWSERAVRVGARAGEHIARSVLDLGSDSSQLVGGPRFQTPQWRENLKDKYPSTGTGEDIATMAAEVVAPLGRAKAALSSTATVGQKVLRAATEGGAFAGLLGDESSIEDRAKNVAQGAVLGGAVGGVGHGLTRGTARVTPEAKKAAAIVKEKLGEKLDLPLSKKVGAGRWRDIGQTDIGSQLTGKLHKTLMGKGRSGGRIFAREQAANDQRYMAQLDEAFRGMPGARDAAFAEFNKTRDVAKAVAAGRNAAVGNSSKIDLKVADMGKPNELQNAATAANASAPELRGFPRLFASLQGKELPRKPGYGRYGLDQAKANMPSFKQSNKDWGLMGIPANSRSVVGKFRPSEAGALTLAAAGQLPMVPIPDWVTQAALGYVGARRGIRTLRSARERVPWVPLRAEATRKLKKARIEQFLTGDTKLQQWYQQFIKTNGAEQAEQAVMNMLERSAASAGEYQDG